MSYPHHSLARLVSVPTLLLMAGCVTPRPPSYACKDCSVTLERVATLGDGSEDGIWGPPRWARQDADGRIYVRADLGEPEPFVFSADGGFVERLSTDRLVSAVIPTANGEVYVVETGTVGSGSVLRSLSDPTRAPVPLPFSVDGWPNIATGADWFVSLRQGEVGDPSLVQVGFDGQVLREFGPIATTDSLPEWLVRTTTHRVLAPASAGGVWAAASNYEYRIERWADDGSLVEVIEPGSPWFEPYLPGERIESRWGAWPSVVGIWEDDQALWIVGLAVDPSWDPSGRSNAELLSAGEGLFPEQYDVIIEAIDPGTGQVLVTGRFPDLGGFPQVLAPGVIGIPRRVDPGFWQIDVLHVSAELD